MVFAAAELLRLAARAFVATTQLHVLCFCGTAGRIQSSKAPLQLASKYNSDRGQIKEESLAHAR